MPKAEDEFLAAIQYAVTGNYIDFGAMDDVSEDMLGKLLENRADVELNTDELARLKRELEEAGTPIDEINPEVRHLIDEVDLCIAKVRGILRHCMEAEGISFISSCVNVNYLQVNFRRNVLLLY